MPNDSQLSKVKELLGNGKTEDAADLLLTIAKDAGEVHYTSALMLKNQLEQLQQDVIDGVVSDSEQRLNCAKISRRILDLARQIEKGEGPIWASSEQKTKRYPIISKRVLIGIPIVFVIIFFTYQQFSKNHTGIDNREASSNNKVVATLPKSDDAVEKITFKGKVIAIGTKSRPVADAELLIEGANKIYKVGCDKSGRFEFDINQDDYGKQVSITVRANEQEKKLPVKKLTELHFETIEVPLKDFFESN